MAVKLMTVLMLRQTLKKMSENHVGADHMLTIDLTLEEGNLILEALAECPFKSVFELIGQLNQQANCLFVETIDHTKTQTFTFSEHDLSLTIKALGGLPYNRVNGLLVNLNQQIKAQLSHQSFEKVSTAYADI